MIDRSWSIRRALCVARSACTLLALGIVGCDSHEPLPAPPPPGVEVAFPERRDVTEYFNYAGTIESFASVEIRARVDGFLEAVMFDESTEVGAGDLLFQIERAPYEVAVGRATAALARANAAKGLAETRLNRTQQAFDAQAANEIELLEDRAELEQANAEVLAAQEDLRAAELDLSYTEVRAPVSGRIDRNYVDVGNLVGREGATLLARIDVLDPVRVSFDVSESIVLKYLSLGQNRPEEAGFPPVELGLSDEDGYPHAGRVDFNENAVDGDTATLEVRAELPNPTGKLYPGLFARIRVPWDTREDAVLIYEEAVSTGLEGKFVLVVDDDNLVSRRVVTLGSRQDDGMVVVLDGLGHEDRYIVRGIQKARPGRPVEPTDYIHAVGDQQGTQP